MSRSIPIEKAMDDALIAIYQNGERLRPENGYPMRLLLPGWEGNTNVKWLRRLKVVAEPVMTKDETSKYTDSLRDGKALQFTFPMECEVGDHVAVRRLDDAGARAVSDFGAGVVRRGADSAGRRVGGWRQDVGPGGGRRAGPRERR